MLVKVERLSRDLKPGSGCSTRRSPERSQSWPTWPGDQVSPGTFEEYIASQLPSSQAGDFAVLEAGIVSEETYVEQGLYWEKSYHPIIDYVMDTYKPDLALVGYPVTDEVQHQFLGLVTKTLPERRRQPRLRRRPGQRHARWTGQAARAFIRRPIRAPTRRCVSLSATSTASPA